ncbi:5'-AMP-activated protein kinase subunit gamma [Neolecta irregularis DAH-3]|uniref:5'-AMP-activated protein kinase subunit gamma n=1 Tax=Neolecta irregularis (strain DAH-3) TaxID=1198029 RepID=A0A1U7LTL1_NEOID|nr:5'-AMP-activated protein kinase subunit gamma [Neolecta irregularis DAH-3]|eukprot:OLL26015.1 5'-AMP-activated protein kinase subunit gamma [Neolecta irregularis DAH-3]
MYAYMHRALQRAPAPDLASTIMASTLHESTSEDTLDAAQQDALDAIRSFIQSRTSYDVFPVSFRLIVLDTQLLVRKSLNILLQNNIVSAPLWDSNESKFSGLLTVSDFINVIQYYQRHTSLPQALLEMEDFKLHGLRDIEKKIGAPPPETYYIAPSRSLYDACKYLIKSRARRIPLVDINTHTGKEMLVSVLTQYRILKFIAVNCKETTLLKKSLAELHIGTYDELLTADMNTPVLRVIDMLAKHDIASVPIVDKEGVVLNVYEAVDVLTIIRAGQYGDLELTVGQALLRRPDEFAGVHKCTEQDTLAGIFNTIRRERLYRLVVVDDAGKLKGMVTLSDILKYMLDGNGDEHMEHHRASP